MILKSDLLFLCTVKAFVLNYIMKKYMKVNADFIAPPQNYIFPVISFILR